MSGFKHCFERTLRKALDFIAVIVALFLPSKKGIECLPPIRDPILLQSCVKLVDKIKAGQLKSETVVKAFIKRVEEVDPLINAVTDRRFEDAIREAQAIDRKISELRQSSNSENDELFKLPLLGVPFTGKDSLAVKGMNQTAGLYARKSFKSDEDAIAIRNIRKAGAILIGITNVPELCMWFDSDNTIFGRTNNPYDLSRVPGGSTGGNAACLAYAGSAIGIGSDIGGSIRMPSFFCGIFGHKTTNMVVPTEGHYPDVGEREKFLAAGPMCRYAADLKPFLKAMAGDNISKIAKIDEKVDFKKLKFYYGECSGEAITSPVQNEILNAIHKVVNHFAQNFGCSVRKHQFDEVKHSFDIFRYTLVACNCPPMSAEMTQHHGEVNLELELIKNLLGLSQHTLPVIICALLEKYTPKQTNGTADPDYVRMGRKLNEELTSLLGDEGIYVFPCHPEVAPKHKTTLLKFQNIAYSAIFNMLDVAITQCPVGLNSEGVPVGVQIIAKAYNDHLTLAVAEEIERAFGGWVPPSKIVID
ncbi:fatty-acid amide hydrolase 2-like protein [Leptotrombidium deliense]|uniref:Fatty-acid amide hydrolase 2-like protein n=1 Tax=Leptotrombidium deliense TaxID=299467 RepID=A0A443SBP2_9ACAR|nr:fatty-acid amide hydrolase 2-like protein [Leptotrombidium deliense]